ncbi:plasmid replication protein RepC [Rhizobium sp. C4]|uniref:plasmid replication protein RepC n=1 Tax=Rhizobium sp. C4 TaxID=1349800 RepID=UPI001E32A87B|nr:plasmid replication protein RepC [Rhizobium sp. C4]MCD2174331.1 replication initiation protein [Rhizobium sp. C4]
MNDDIATTPFGGGRMVARQFLRRKQVTEAQAKLAETKRPGAGADKWQLLRALTEAKSAYGLSDRSIAVLEALLSFHPERLLDGSKPLIVFPSNQQLSLRARGMSPATIRRHIATLVEAGLIFRRDSPNGKRYCRRDAHGAPQDMFGFDLAPLGLAADAIHAQAERIRGEERRRQGLRGEVTLHLRDIAKLLQAALNEGRAGDWEHFEARLEALSGRVGRNATIEALTERRDGLLRLRAELENAYVETISAAELSASVHQFEHHIQNPESDQTHESAMKIREEIDQTATDDAGEKAEAAGKQSRETISLSRILTACPQIADYSRNGIGNWADFMGAVVLVRAMLRISPAAWNTACAAMGEIQAAIAVAAILERAEHIRAPGGYLRALASKALSGKFALGPVLRALEQSGERRHCEPARAV